MKFPLVFAHRGFHTFAPENSLRAFQQAFHIGCDGIEVDVRFNRDRRIVVFHDRNTYRMTGIRRSIQKMHLPEIKSLSLRNGGYESRENIPLLSDILEMAGKNRQIIIDVKKERLTDNGFEESLITLLKRMNLQENIIISSFNPMVLKKISQLGNIHTGFIFRNKTSIMMLNGQPIKSLHARYNILSQNYIRQLRNRASQIFAWTVDDPGIMHSMIANGVDAIITNHPDKLLAIKKQSVLPLPVSDESAP